MDRPGEKRDDGDRDADTRVGATRPRFAGGASLELGAGEIVANRFEIQHLAGAGGMGTVYRAIDRVTGEPVALKLLNAAGERDAARFMREGELLAELGHPAVVRYVAHGVALGQKAFLAMEWLDGEDLAARLFGEGLTIGESVRVVAAAASALGVAHRRGVVHRDVKPSNLFLVGGRLDHVKVLDFGVARASFVKSALTRTGMTIGTPAYMAPEQARGAAGIDARADVFALGCVLFECIAQRPAFLGDHMVAVLARILFEEPPRLASIVRETPPGLDDLVARMLAKEPSERPADGDEVARALASIEAPAGDVRRRRELPPPEIGATEQRLVSVVLTAPIVAVPADSSLAPTLPFTAVSGGPEPRSAAIARFGGRFEHLADGSLVAILQGSGAATDQASRAARCALAMRADAAGAPMALATGRAVVADRWPVGEAIDRAARILSSARRAGRTGIRIDEVTTGLLGPRFDVGGDDGGLELRGEIERSEPARTLLGKPTSCVGREREIAMLLGVLDECAAEPAARAVLVTSPAGMGKSRLRYELLRRVRDRDERVEVWVGRGDPIGAGSPFGLLADALSGALGLDAANPKAVQEQKIRARVARHVDPAEAPRVAEFLGEIVGVPFPDNASVQLRTARQDATLMGDQMRRAWEDFVAAECAAQPVVLVLEDLHWGDLPTMSFVDDALRRCADDALMVLGLGRNEVHTLFPSLWAERNLTAVRLGEVSKKACEKLARETLGAGVSDADLARIVERAAGNAFYLEELIRAVAEGRGAELPETVLAMVHARLEALDPEARRVLRAGSVFGQTFRRGGVLALLGGSPRVAQVVEWLPDLVKRELLSKRASGKTPDDDEYVFRHALVREAAYATLTDADRAIGHQLAGEWLAVVGERDALALAQHFDRGGAPERAAEYYETAAAEALEGHDFAAALARVAKARACSSDDGARGELCLVEAEAHRWTGDFAAAEQAAERAAEILPEGSAAWYRAIEEAMIARGRRGDFAAAEAMAGKLGTAPRDEGAASARVICLCSAARQLFHAGRYELADAILDHVRPLAGDVNPRARAEVHRLAGARARHVGDLVGDAAGYEAALRAFEQAGDARNAENSRVSLGFSNIELGDFEAARAALEQAKAATERMGLQTVLRRARQNLALVLAHAGALDEAAAHAMAAIDAAHAQGDLRFAGWTRVYLSRIRLAAGDLAGAEREARAAADLLATTPPARAGALAALSQSLLAAGQIQDAFTAAREAHAVLEALGGIEEFEPLIRIAWAEAAHAAGETMVAKEVIAAARARIQAQAAAIADETRRARFLRDVPDNARILSLASQWLAGAAD